MVTAGKCLLLALVNIKCCPSVCFPSTVNGQTEDFENLCKHFDAIELNSTLLAKQETAIKLVMAYSPTDLITLTTLTNPKKISANTVRC